jgi:hypothetical protein
MSKPVLSDAAGGVEGGYFFFFGREERMGFDRLSLDGSRARGA